MVVDTRQMNMLYSYLFLFIASLTCICAAPGEARSQSNDTVRICFTGDVMLGRGVRQKVDKEGKDFLFGKIAPVLQAYEYRFVNLESPLTVLNHPPRKPYSFRADTGFVTILTEAGITHAGLANNHIDDQTAAGANDTYKVLSKNGIVPLGLRFGNSDTCNPAEIRAGGRKVAVFAALGLDMKAANVWYCFDSLFARSVGSYKRNNPAAFVVCYLHWGEEYRRFPVPEQKRIATMLIDSGADMIIGHHPHVVESIRYYKGRPILYSLGNLVFDQRDAITKKGIVAGLAIAGSEVSVEIIPYDILEYRPILMPAKEREGFRKSLLRISSGIALTDDGPGWRLQEVRVEGKSDRAPDGK